MTWRLFTAARDGDLARVQACLAAGADPNGRHLVAYGSPTQTPLEAAVSGGHATCAAALLAAGADPGTAITSQLTVLHLAAVTGSAACIQALLNAGANPSAGAPSGLTPLHFAAAAADSRCAAALLAAGASPSAVAWDNDGAAPIHAAVALGRRAALRLMLAAQPQAALVADARGRTPLEMALQRGHALCALALLRSGALPSAGEALSLLCQHSAWGPLYAALAARHPLTAAEWALVPSPCHGLGSALPSVLQRCTWEAALLVRHLRRAARQRLRCFALCLSTEQRRRTIPTLPSSLAWRLLALSCGAAPREGCFLPASACTHPSFLP